ncbi:MAG: LamG-like jellyroll fold domain-containing protein, partial [Dehalococcoidia bacterium]
MAFAAKPKTAKRFARWPIVRNADSPQAKGLRAWWPLYRLDDAYDLGPAGKFRLVRQAAGVTWVADGQRGFVASFDNTSNAKFQGTGLAPLAAPPITITGWFVHSSSATVDRIFSIADGSSDTIRAWTTSANKMLVQEIGATANEKVVGSIGITTSSWMHFAFTTDGANKELFIDGVSDKTGSVNVGAHSWVDVAVGGTAWTSGANYNGELSDWRIYDRILSSSEIAFLVEEPWDLFHEIVRRTIIIFGASGATKQLAGVSTTQTTGAGL